MGGWVGGGKEEEFGVETAGEEESRRVGLWWVGGWVVRLNG